MTVEARALQTTWEDRLMQAAPGLLLTLAFGAASFLTWWLLRGTWLKFSALFWAFIYSIIVTNALPWLSSGRFAVGLDLGASRLLRLSIALLGLTISASVWAALGGVGVLAVLLNLAIAFLFATVFCRYVLKMDGAFTVLLAVGTSICGASAIAATAPAVKAKAEEIAVAVAAVTLFGLVAMFAYPALFNGPLRDWLGGSTLAFGMWTGMGVHETAQVIAASSQVDGASAIAMSAKSIRIFMIGPMVFGSMLLHQYLARRGGVENRAMPAIPWFAVAFVLFTLVHTVLESMSIGQSFKSFNSTWLTPVVTFLLASAFAAVGFKVKISAIRVMGPKAFLAGIVVAIAAGVSALLLAKYLWLGLGS